MNTVSIFVYSFLWEEAVFVIKSYQILCEYLAADKWKILGQEQDGFVLSWDSKDGVLKSSTTKVGFVDLENNILKVGCPKFLRVSCFIMADITLHKY
jgi:hypothetical protein